MPPDLKFFDLQGLHFGNWDGSLSQNGISCGAEYARSHILDSKVFLIKNTEFRGPWGVFCPKFGKKLNFPSYLMILFGF